MCLCLVAGILIPSWLKGGIKFPANAKLGSILRTVILSQLSMQSKL